MNNVNVLVGQTLSSMTATDDAIYFQVDGGKNYRLYHSQDCCESVYIESIVGDLQDLVGHPLLTAEEVSSHDGEDGAKALSEYDESYTWTFYKFATVKGYVDVRWYGSSNGYYSESVDFEETDDGRRA